MGAECNICTKQCNFKTTAALIVDCNALSNELMQRTLSGLKMKHIHRAFSIEDALSLISSNEIGIVVINADTIRDKAFPFLELVRFRQTKDPIPEAKIRQLSIVPFVITSSTVTPEMAEKAAGAGICALVSMPLKPLDFMKKVKNLLYVHCEENCFNATIPSLEGAGVLDELGSPC